jgi:hypothetical protein
MGTFVEISMEIFMEIYGTILTIILLKSPLLSSG